MGIFTAVRTKINDLTLRTTRLKNTGAIFARWDNVLVTTCQKTMTEKAKYVQFFFPVQITVSLERLKCKIDVEKFATILINEMNFSVAPARRRRASGARYLRKFGNPISLLFV